MPFGFHPAYLVVILVVVLVIFGPGKLPQLGGAVGRAMRDFQRSVSGAHDEEPPAEAGVVKAEGATTTTTTEPK